MKLAACLATVSTVLVLGCSNSGDSSSAIDSGSNGGACPTVAACGGTIVPGTYTITSFCEHSDPVPADELCQGATVAMSDADLSGVVVFSDATNYVTGVSETIHSVLYWPSSCLGKLGGPTTCAELQQRFGPDQAAPPDHAHNRHRHLFWDG